MSLISAQLTVCILAKNEEARIGKAVASVGALGAKLLIVDCFSDDETFQTAREAWRGEGRALVDFEFTTRTWLGFARSREESMKLIKTRWGLWLDADEWIESDLLAWLQAHLEYLNPDEVYAFRRQSFFMGRQMRYGGWYPDFQARLCRIGHANWTARPRGTEEHEELISAAAPGRRVNIDAHLGHQPFGSYAELRETADHDSTRLAAALRDQWRSQNRKPYAKLLQQIKVVGKFAEIYLWRAGFLDGPVGYRVAASSAWSLKRRIEKARELYWTRA